MGVYYHLSFCIVLNQAYTQATPVHTPKHKHTYTPTAHTLCLTEHNALCVRVYAHISIRCAHAGNSDREQATLVARAFTMRCSHTTLASHGSSHSRYSLRSHKHGSSAQLLRSIAFSRHTLACAFRSRKGLAPSHLVRIQPLPR